MYVGTAAVAGYEFLKTPPTSDILPAFQGAINEATVNVLIGALGVITLVFTVLMYILLELHEDTEIPHYRARVSVKVRVVDFFWRFVCLAIVSLKIFSLQSAYSLNGASVFTLGQLNNFFFFVSSVSLATVCWFYASWDLVPWAKSRPLYLSGLSAIILGAVLGLIISSLETPPSTLAVPILLICVVVMLFSAAFVVVMLYDSHRVITNAVAQYIRSW